MNKRSFTYLIIIASLIAIIDVFYFYTFIKLKDCYLYDIIDYQPLYENLDKFEGTEILLDWDYIFIFEPYTSSDIISDKIGFRYVNRKDYITYRFFKRHTDLNDDIIKKVIVIKNKKVVCDINYNSNDVDFRNNIYSSEGSPKFYLEKQTDKIIIDILHDD